MIEILIDSEALFSFPSEEVAHLYCEDTKDLQCLIDHLMRDLDVEDVSDVVYHVLAFALGAVNVSDKYSLGELVTEVLDRYDAVPPASAAEGGDGAEVIALVDKATGHQYHLIKVGDSNINSTTLLSFSPEEIDHFYYEDIVDFQSFIDSIMHDLDTEDIKDIVYYVLSIALNVIDDLEGRTALGKLVAEAFGQHNAALCCGDTEGDDETIVLLVGKVTGHQGHLTKKIITE